MSILREINALRNGGYFRDFEDKEDYYLCTCPFHKDGKEKTPSFSINKKRIKTHKGILEEGYVHCFGCGYKGTFTRFLADVRGVSEFEILKQMRKDLIWEDKRELLLSLNRTEEKKEFEINVLPLDSNGRAYLKNRKLSDEVIERFGIGSDKYSNIVFPLVDKVGEVIAEQKRAIREKKFYNTEGFDKMAYLYGLYQVLTDLESDTVYIVESIIDCLTLWSWGYNSIALMGSKYSDYHITEICKLNKHIVLALDNDDVGKSAMFKLKNVLVKKGRRVDVIRWGNTREKDINDLTKEKFEKLI